MAKIAQNFQKDFEEQEDFDINDDFVNEDILPEATEELDKENNYQDRQVDYDEIAERNKLNTGQKIGVGLLAFFGLFILVFWYSDFKKSIQDPPSFSGAPAGQNELNNFTGAGSDLSADTEYLKTIDTDGDGLSDYDEIFIHGTSPYLADTDGDGISDYDEIFIHGTDPLCPQGSACDQPIFKDIEEAVDPLENFQTNSNMADLLKQIVELETSPGYETEEELLFRRLVEGETDPDTLRLLLAQLGGMSPEMLNQISDEALMDVYKKSLGR